MKKHVHSLVFRVDPSVRHIKKKFSPFHEWISGPDLIPPHTHHRYAQESMKNKIQYNIPPCNTCIRAEKSTCGGPWGNITTGTKRITRNNSEGNNTRLMAMVVYGAHFSLKNKVVWLQHVFFFINLKKNKKQTNTCIKQSSIFWLIYVSIEKTSWNEHNWHVFIIVREEVVEVEGSVRWYK